MKLLRIIFLLFIPILMASCGAARKAASHKDDRYDTRNNHASAITKDLSEPVDINPKELINYAKRFLGTPYKYGSTDPSKGFDCSGFVYYVLAHFGVKAPRISYEYGSVGKDVKVKNAKAGDIILFTSPGSKGKIGHMGFVTENEGDTLSFIHSSSPRSGGVIVSTLRGYYKEHFVKVIRILK